jgi:uncharacterized membrane protein
MFKPLLVSFAFISSGTAFSAEYNICNRTSDTLLLAYALTEEVIDPVFGSGSSSAVESQGWYKVDIGECRTFTFNQSRHYAYFYAKAKGGTGSTWTGTSAKFCVGSSLYPYKFQNQAVNVPARCSQAGGVLEGFQYVKPGTHNFNDDRTHVQYCNRTDRVVYESTTMYENNTWTSRGWNRMDPHSCRIERMGTYRGDIYVGGFNVMSGQNFWQGPTQFCVHSTQPFKYPFADSMTCQGDNMRMGFYKMTVGRGITTFNFDL